MRTLHQHLRGVGVTRDPATQEGLDAGEPLKVRQGQPRATQGEGAHPRIRLVDERAQYLTREVGVVHEQRPDAQGVAV